MWSTTIYNNNPAFAIKFMAHVRLQDIKKVLFSDIILETEVKSQPKLKHN